MTRQQRRAAERAAVKEARATGTDEQDGSEWDGVGLVWSAGLREWAGLEPVPDGATVLSDGSVVT